MKNKRNFASVSNFTLLCLVASISFADNDQNYDSTKQSYLESLAADADYFTRTYAVKTSNGDVHFDYKKIRQTSPVTQARFLHFSHAMYLRNGLAKGTPIASLHASGAPKYLYGIATEKGLVIMPHRSKLNRFYLSDPHTGVPRGGKPLVQLSGEKGQRYADYLSKNVLNSKTRLVDERKLSKSPYDVRAWWETVMVLAANRAEPMTGNGVSPHTDWGKKVHGHQKNRFENLVEKVSYGGGYRMHVVPHPMQKGNFIVVDHNGKEIHRNNIDRWGKQAKAKNEAAKQSRIANQPQRYARLQKKDLYQLSKERRRLRELQAQARNNRILSAPNFAGNSTVQSRANSGNYQSPGEARHYYRTRPDGVFEVGVGIPGNQVLWTQSAEIQHEWEALLPPSSLE